jgi:hypothetical protein
MELTNIILSEVNQIQKFKDCMFSPICRIQKNTNTSILFKKKQVILLGGHIQEREGKRKKLIR